MRALECLHSYEERGIPMQAWLVKIAHNLIVDYLRKAAKRKTVPIDTVPVEAPLDPRATAEARIEFARVTRALDPLTLAQRQVMELRLFGGLT